VHFVLPDAIGIYYEKTNMGLRDTTNYRPTDIACVPLLTDYKIIGPCLSRFSAYYMCRAYYRLGSIHYCFTYASFPWTRESRGFSAWSNRSLTGCPLSRVWRCSCFELSCPYTVQYPV